MDLCFWKVQPAVTKDIYQSEGSSPDSKNHFCTMPLSCFLETFTKGNGACWNAESENLSSSLIMWECFSLSSPLNNLENCRRVFAFAAWAFIWLSRRPKSLFDLEQQSVKITHCIKIFSCRCSLLPVMFTQHFNQMQGHLKYRVFCWLHEVSDKTKQCNLPEKDVVSAPRLSWDRQRCCGV